MPILARQGIAFHYTDSGAGGVPFVFQHGLGGDCTQPVGLFAPPDWLRIICLDCRGHGNTHSLGPVESLGFATYADDVVALLDSLSQERAIVGGISMGAGIALNIAHRHAGRVLGLVLVRPAWLSETMPGRRWYDLIATLIHDFGPEEGLDAFLSSPQYAEISRAAPAVAQSLAAQFKTAHIEATAVKFARLSADIPFANATFLETLRVPTLVVATRLDPVHPYEYGTFLAGRIPGAEFVEVTAKSVSENEHRRQLQAAVDKFLAGRFAPGG